MQHSVRLLKLMRLSWEIQLRNPSRLHHKQRRLKKKRSIRSLAMEAAWTIMCHEEITVHHLVRRHSHENKPNKVKPQELTLFQ
jgi:hypothetical protein